VALAPALGPEIDAITGQEALVRTFLHHHLDHRPHPATPEERAALRWLATQMAHRPGALRIDQLRQTWLPDAQRLLYRGLLGLAFVWWGSCWAGGWGYG